MSSVLHVTGDNDAVSLKTAGDFALNTAAFCCESLNICNVDTSCEMRRVAGHKSACQHPGGFTLEHDTVASYWQFVEKVDGHLARVSERHPDAMRCRLGCTACCRQDLSVSRIEAEQILGWLAMNGVPEACGDRTEHDNHPRFEQLAGPAACPFLSTQGACGIYPVRPIICRTHGFPVRLSAGEVDVCPLNFEDEEALPKEDVIDLELLNKTLSLIAVLHAQQVGDDTPGRYRLSSLREVALQDDV